MILKLTAADGDLVDLSVVRLTVRRGLGLAESWLAELPWNGDGADTAGQALVQATLAQTTASLRMEGEQEPWVSHLHFLAARRSADRRSWEILLSPPAPPRAHLRAVWQAENTLQLFERLHVTVRGGADGTGLSSALQSDGPRMLIADRLSNVEAAQALLEDYRHRRRVAEQPIRDSHLALQAKGGGLELVCASGHDGSPPEAEDLTFGFERRHWEKSPFFTEEKSDPFAAPARGVARESEAVRLEIGWFQSWRKQALPVSLRPAQGAASLVHRSRDILSNQEGHVYWKTVLEEYPGGCPPVTRPAFQPWAGMAKVTGKVDARGCLPLELIGFNPARLQARLCTPYSGGKEGDAGLHLPPALESTVLVFWSGRTDDWPYCLGNVREKGPRHPELFLDLPGGPWKWKTEQKLAIEAGNDLDLTAGNVSLSASDKVKVSKG